MSSEMSSSMEQASKRQKMDFEYLITLCDFEASTIEDLPDEVLLKIFSFLPMKSLFQLMAVNKKFRSVANDESLWKKVHLMGHSNTDRFPPEFLNKLIEKGCQYLAFDCCRVERREVKFEKNFTLKYLSFDVCQEIPNEEFDIFPEFAASCHGLEKFYAKRDDNVDNDRKSYAIIDSRFFKCIIQSSDTLQVLNLSAVQLDFDSVQHIVTLCQELRELKVSGDWFIAQGQVLCLCQDSVDFLCNNLTTKIEKLDITGQPNFGDEQLEVLVKRCNRLTEFKFYGGEVTEKSVDVIVENLSQTLTKLWSWSEELKSPALRKLTAMPHLKVLAEPELDWEEDIDDEEVETERRMTVEEFRRLMPHMPEDYMSETFEIAEPYHFFDKADYQKGFTANRFWDVKAKPRIYDVCQWHCENYRDENCQCHLLHANEKKQIMPPCSFENKI